MDQDSSGNTDSAFRPLFSSSPSNSSETIQPQAFQTVTETGRFDANEEDEGEAAYGDTTVLSLPPVSDYRGAIPNEWITGETFHQMLDLPTFQARRRMRDASELVRRREECINRGMTALNKPHLPHCKIASRRLQYNVFKDELKELDGLLTRVERNEARQHDREGISYTPHGVYRFEAFRRGEANDSFARKGKLLPDLPILGIDGDVDAWHLEDDFEIVGVCFRLEVEDLLAQLDTEYDFVRGVPRTMDSEITDSVSAHQVTSTFHRESPPHLPTQVQRIISPTRPEASPVVHVAHGGAQTASNQSVSRPRMDHRMWGGIPDIRRNFAAGMYSTEAGPSHHSTHSWVPRGV
ncbi:hypothetical protein C8J57DRAFT_1612085, partial [Mycena rebaudengoi]